MKNARPTCPTVDCVHHTSPPAGFYRKRGYRYPKHSRRPVPVYQCKACGAYFSATQSKPIRQQHRPDLNREIFKLAVSGVSMRRMETLLGCAKGTIALKIRHLAKEAQKHHAAFLANPANHTSHAMMDELETFVHARWKQLAVPVVIRPKTGQVLAFDVCRKPTSMPKQKLSWDVDQRPQSVPNTIVAASAAFKPNVTLTTDGSSSYPKWVKASGVKLKHEIRHSPNGNREHDPLFGINVLFAKMRNDLARLGRKTWTTTKTVQGLKNHVWLYVAWVNGYDLK